jgi:outer membrane protein TolC
MGCLTKRPAGWMHLLFQIDSRPFQAEVDRLTSERVRAISDLDLAKANRARAERVTEFDVQSSRTPLKATEATIPQLEAAAKRYAYRLAVLAGERPGTLTQLAAEDAVAQAQAANNVALVASYKALGGVVRPAPRSPRASRAGDATSSI